ncbi:nucleotidyltransferase family protein [Clostridium sp. D33t1_170424_F3]|uniref:tRNA(Met) cytidine acetate ligase n=1 Tax=Clostridium sp. D33t1_170424_F3 TaxID=2787099 RepID=UPI0018A9ABD9|nr:nucleotidyltransferase family protein [Clostridium sp. D33t1_170424_F3]
MLIAGIICEYNPFHLGHMALIEETRWQGATHIAAVMSGNFVQRGEPAILSKNARTRQALLCGADLVVELPLPWAMAGAEKFALGGVSLLDALGCEQISFGSECGDAHRIFQLAGLLHSPAFPPVLREELATGATFARARERAVARIVGPETAALLSGANNTLGIEYAKAIRTLHSSMQLFTMKRVGAAHDSHENVSISSASRIRAMIHDGVNFSSHMPHDAAKILLAEIQDGRAPAFLPRMERAILAKLRSMPQEDFAALPDVSEGLENRIYQSVHRAGSLDELYDLIKTKRYPLARIRRIVLSAFLGLTAAHAEGLPPYIRVLGMNRRGAEILHVSKMTTKRPIVANTSDILSLDNLAKNMIELECKSTDIYALFLPDPPPCGWDRTAGIIKV